MWQDWALGALNIWFILTMIPVLCRPSQVPLATSVTTGLGLLAGAGVLLSLGLVFSATCQAIVGAEWLVLAGQTRAKRR